MPIFLRNAKDLSSQSLQGKYFVTEPNLLIGSWNEWFHSLNWLSSGDKKLQRLQVGYTHKNKPGPRIAILLLCFIYTKIKII